MTLKNIARDQEYDTREELIEDLIDRYVEIQREKYTLASAEMQLIADLQRLAEESSYPDNSKVRTLVGVTQCVKVTPRNNVTYDKTEDGNSFLADMYSKYPQQMDSLVRVEYKERAAQIEKLLSDDTDSELSKLIAEHRRTKEGKPIIKVEVL